ncbi:hypothetical protein HanIR_Chr01g0042211 [Helianthus annuus]|nr:hypothetical protein HanIR_Chr01g0042211 [Helianthus annuus]
MGNTRSKNFFDVRSCLPLSCQNRSSQTYHAGIGAPKLTMFMDLVAGEPDLTEMVAVDVDDGEDSGGDGFRPADSGGGYVDSVGVEMKGQCG